MWGLGIVRRGLDKILVRIDVLRKIMRGSVVFRLVECERGIVYMLMGVLWRIVFIKSGYSISVYYVICRNV